MKKSGQILLAIFLISVTFIVSAALVRRNTELLKLSSEHAAMIKEPRESVAELLLSKNIKMVESWYVSDSSLLCIVQGFDYDPHYEGSGEKLTIYNESGVKLYEDYFTSVGRMYLAGALLTEEAQLVVEVNLGGNSTNFLEMLDYREGKVVEVPIKGYADFNAGAEVRPQFRRGIIPAKEPYQIMLTEGVGLASPVEKITRLYRYKNGAYRYVGKFNQHDVDDHIEKLIAKDSLDARKAGKEDLPNER